MWDRRMIGVPNRPGKKTIEIDIPNWRESWPTASVAPRRQADIGYPALTYVMVISAVEAAQINVGFKRRAEEKLRANLAEMGDGHIRHEKIDGEVFRILRSLEVRNSSA